MSDLKSLAKNGYITQLNNSAIGQIIPSTGVFTSLVADSLTTINQTITGDLTVADKIVHLNDTNTNIRFPSADTVTVETNGVERLRVDSSGNVGIGISNPLAKLDVYQPSAVAGLASARFGVNAGGGSPASLSGLTTYWNLSDGFAESSLVYGNTPFSFMTFGKHDGTSYSETMRIDSSGNIGIGVAPVAGYGTSLQMKNGGGAAVTLLHQSVDVNNQRLELLNNALPPAGGFTDTYKYTFTGASATAYKQQTGRHAWLTAPVGNAGDTVTFTQAMTLDENGKLGIGTSGPAEKLSVFQGNIYALRTGGAKLRLLDENNEVSVESAPVSVGSGTNMVFKTNALEHMRINADGNVGIGTASPTNFGGSWRTLHVAGANTTIGGVLRLSTSDNSVAFDLFTDTVGAVVRATTDHPMIFLTNGIERARILSSGEVYINTTTNPGGGFGSERLVIEGDTGNAAFIRTTGTAGNGTALSTGRTSNGIHLSFHQSNTFVGSITTNADSAAFNVRGETTGIYSPASNVIGFRSTGTERMCINADGNVGIGVASPTSRLDIAETWNSSGTTFTGVKLNVTDTASNAASKLIDLQVGGSSMFNVTKAGKAVAVDFGQTIGGSGFYTNGIFSNANYFTAYAIAVLAGGVDTVSHVRIRSSSLILSDPEANNPVYVTRDGAGILAQRNGINPQTSRIYNTFTDASNYERATIGWSSNVLQIGTEAAGTGIRRSINLNYTTTIDGNSRTNVPALTITNVGAGDGGLLVGQLKVGCQQDWSRLTAFYTANKALAYDHGGAGVANQGIHRFTTDNNGGTSSGSGGSIVDILAPSTATNAFQCRQADGTVVLNVSYNGAITTANTVTASAEATTLATTSKTQVASFPVASFRSGKLIVQAYDSVTGEVQISELLVAHNGTTASATEYGVVYTGSNAIVTYDVDISGSNVRLMATRTSANSTQYKISETLMVA